ncbi:MAG TPA: hypothetical protein VD994_10165, partial [Prosthecobacter sp.]|nr:hypothetical protein [Prosthecobacter sp.]
MSVASAVSLAGFAPAAEARLLLEEHFESTALPAAWKPGGRPNSFTIADGALQGTASPDDAHGPSISVPLEGDNLKVAFR